MSTFLNSGWNKYEIKARPHELVRRWFRLYRGYFPYFSGQQIGMILYVYSLNKFKEKEEIKLFWKVNNHTDGKEYGSGEFIFSMSPKQKVTHKIATKLIIDSGNYVLRYQITKSNKQNETSGLQELAVLSVKDRGEVVISLIVPSIISLIALVISIIAIVRG